MRRGLVYFSASISVLLISVGARAAVPGVTDTEIKIGVIAAASGPMAPVGNAIFAGTKAFVKRINDAGGVAGRKLVIVFADDAFTPEKTVAIAKKMLTEDKVFALLSVFGAATSKAILPLVRTEDVPLIGPISAMNHSSPTDHNVFMTRADAQEQAQFLVKHLNDDLGIREIGVFYQEDAFGTAGLSGFSKALSQVGLKVQGQGGCLRLDDQLQTAINSIVARKPKAVAVYAVSPSVETFIKAMVDQGHKQVIVGPNIVTPQVLGLSEKIDSKIFTALSTPLFNDASVPLLQEYATDLKATGGKPSQFGSEAYLNAAIFTEALKIAGKDLTRDSFRKALESMGNADIHGVKVSFSATNRQGIHTPALGRIFKGQLSPISKLD